MLRGRAVILEVTLKEDNKEPSLLELKSIGPKERPYRKHFLDLGGLGIRDLHVQGSDLPILPGPTMNLEGLVMVLQWRKGAAHKGECLVPADELDHVWDVPYGKDGGTRKV